MAEIISVISLDWSLLLLPNCLALWFCVYTYVGNSFVLLTLAHWQKASLWCSPCSLNFRRRGRICILCQASWSSCWPDSLGTSLCHMHHRYPPEIEDKSVYKIIIVKNAAKGRSRENPIQQSYTVNILLARMTLPQMHRSKSVAL